MWFLVRLCEPGHEATRRRTEQDLVAALSARVELRHVEHAPGRLFLRTDTDVTEVLQGLPGLVSFSRCERARLEDLVACVSELCGPALQQATSFAVRVHRVGTHDLSSLQLAANVGHALRQQHPHLRVDLRNPALEVGIEIRERNAYVFDAVIPGLDRIVSTTADNPSAAAGHETRFMVDRMLAPLARWLRLMGFDARYAPDLADSAIAREARADARVVLTRDRAFAATRSVQTVFVQQDRVEDQVFEVVTAVGLELRRGRMLTRCTLCNALLEEVAASGVAHLVPAAVAANYECFYRCRACAHVYWKGAHCRRILARMEHLLTL